MKIHIAKVDKPVKKDGFRYLCRFKADPYKDLRGWHIIEYVANQKSWRTDTDQWFSSMKDSQVEEMYRLYTSPMPQNKKGKG